MKTTTLDHLTLSTGHRRISRLSDCDDGFVTLAAQHLAEALELREAPIRDGYTLRAGSSGKALMATILGTLEGLPMPLATIAVATSGRAARLAWAEIGKPAPLALPTVPWVREPKPPWCSVRLYATIEFDPGATAGWLGDYEQCLAWAWVDGRVRMPKPEET